MRIITPFRDSRTGELALHKSSAHCAPVRDLGAEQSRADVGLENTTKAGLLPENSDESRPTACVLVRITHGRRPVTFTACPGVEMTSNRVPVLEARSGPPPLTRTCARAIWYHRSVPWVIACSVMRAYGCHGEKSLTSLGVEHRVEQTERVKRSDTVGVALVTKRRRGSPRRGDPRADAPRRLGRLALRVLGRRVEAACSPTAAGPNQAAREWAAVRAGNEKSSLRSVTTVFATAPAPTSPQRVRTCDVAKSSDACPRTRRAHRSVIVAHTLAGAHHRRSLPAHAPVRMRPPGALARRATSGRAQHRDSPTLHMIQRR